MRGTEVTDSQLTSAEKFIREVPMNGRDVSLDQTVTLPFRNLVRLVAWYGALRFKGGRDGSGGTLEEPAEIVDASRNDGLPELPGEVISRTIALLKQAGLLGTRKPGEIIPDGLSLQVFEGAKGQKVYVRLFDGRTEQGLKARLELHVATGEWSLDLFMDNGQGTGEGLPEVPGLKEVEIRCPHCEKDAVTIGKVIGPVLDGRTSRKPT